MKIKTQDSPKHMDCSDSSMESEIYRTRAPVKKKKKSSNHQLNFTPQGTRKKNKLNTKATEGRK